MMMTIPFEFNDFVDLSFNSLIYLIIFYIMIDFTIYIIGYSLSNPIFFGFLAFFTNATK